MDKPFRPSLPCFLCPLFFFPLIGRRATASLAHDGTVTSFFLVMEDFLPSFGSPLFFLPGSLHSIEVLGFEALFLFSSGRGPTFFFPTMGLNPNGLPLLISVFFHFPLSFFYGSLALITLTFSL